MYEIAQSELARLLSQRVYPQLRGLRFSYQVGGQWRSLEYDSLLERGTAHGERCAQAAKVIVDELRRSGGVREYGSRQPVKATLYHLQLCRGLGPGDKNRVDGPWWFDVELLRRWEGVYAKEPLVERRKKVLDAIRPMLAICKDWNDLTRLVTITPGGGGIPVLTGQGTPMPVTLKKADVKETEQQRVEREKVVYIGGFQQVYVPFVGLHMVKNYW